MHRPRSSIRARSTRTGAVSFDVVANDVDPDVSDTLTLLTLGAVTVTSLNGDVDGIDASTAFSIVNGKIAFNPGTLFDHLDHDDTATVVVNYTMRDGQNVTSSSTLTLTVNGANDAPTVVADTGTVGENATGVLRGSGERQRPRHRRQPDAERPRLGHRDERQPRRERHRRHRASSRSPETRSIHAGQPLRRPRRRRDATVVVGYTAKDTLDAASSSTLTLTVTGANDAPTAVVDTGSSARARRRTSTSSPTTSTRTSTTSGP